jgi:hypothetical protein
MVTFRIKVIENFDEYNKGIVDKKYHVWTPSSGAMSFYSGSITELKKPLIEWKFIIVEKIGARHIVSLTEERINALRFVHEK